MQNSSMDHHRPFAFVNLETTNESSLLLQISLTWRRFFGIMMVLSLFWGSAMKAFIYVYFKKLKITERPINFLILIGQIIHHVLNLFVGTNIIIELFLDVSPIEFADSYLGLQIDEREYCTAFYFLSSFMVTYLIVGNSIIALYRMVYLRMTSFATVMIGEGFFLFLTLSGGLLITTMMSTLFVQGKSSTRAVYNMCTGYSQKFQVGIPTLFEFR